MNSFRFPSGIAVLLLLGLASCATNPVAVESVGPESPATRSSEGQGRLIVYTAREQSTSGEVIYIRYTSYRIFREDGRSVRNVPNNTGGHDEKPEAVLLEAGVYSLSATAEGIGPVKVPVVIQAVKTTEIHLERGWKPDLKGRDARNLVRLPNGQIVGWRAPIKGTVELDEARASRADAIVKAKLIAAPDTAGATLHYALVEAVTVIRNNTDQPIPTRFTVGYRDFNAGISPSVSLLYLRLAKRADGAFEWSLLED